MNQDNQDNQIRRLYGSRAGKKRSGTECDYRETKSVEIKSGRNTLWQAIKIQNQRHNSSIGALGARWGLQTESAFREGIKGILEEF
ncbi:MAG: DUF3782 domain-containing protein, partial [Desulfobacterales bacterium]|nr:DUF3782 domain-containing protein [Desulfobacterales bacterium]